MNFLFRKKKAEVVTSLDDLDIQAELDVVPIMDLLIIADEETKRKVFLETLKKEFDVYADYIWFASKSHDSEIKLLAQERILEAKKSTKSKMHKMEELYLRDETNVAYGQQYLAFLEKYIKVSIDDDEEREKSMLRYIDVGEKLLAYGKIEKIIQNIIDYQLELGENDQVEYYCNRYVDEYSESEDKYYYQLKALYTMKKPYEFKKTLEAFRESDIVFNQRTLNYIRFWLGRN